MVTSWLRNGRGKTLQSVFVGIAALHVDCNNERRKNDQQTVLCTKRNSKRSVEHFSFNWPQNGDSYRNLFREVFYFRVVRTAVHRFRTESSRCCTGAPSPSTRLATVVAILVLGKNGSWRAADQWTPDLPKRPANLHIIFTAFPAMPPVRWTAARHGSFFCTALGPTAVGRTRAQ